VSSILTVFYTTFKLYDILHKNPFPTDDYCRRFLVIMYYPSIILHKNDIFRRILNGADPSADFINTDIFLYISAA